MRTTFRLCGYIALDISIAVELFERESPGEYIFIRLLYLTKPDEVRCYEKYKKEAADPVFIISVYGVDDG